MGKRDINTKKVAGIALCVLGIVCARAGSFLTLSPQQGLYGHAAGAAIALAGIALYAAGMRTGDVRRIRVCPHCFFKNDAARDTCVKCRNPMIKDGT